jgi:hypothetical protein
LLAMAHDFHDRRILSHTGGTFFTSSPHSFSPSSDSSFSPSLLSDEIGKTMVQILPRWSGPILMGGILISVDFR